MSPQTQIVSAGKNVLRQHARGHHKASFYSCRRAQTHGSRHTEQRRSALSSLRQEKQLTLYPLARLKVHHLLRLAGLNRGESEGLLKEGKSGRACREQKIIFGL